MNFDWMKGNNALSELLRNCREAEEFVIVRPAMSAVAARRAVELIVKWTYAETCGADYDMTVYEMLSAPAFLSSVGDMKIMEHMHLVRKLGNRAAHDGTVNEREAMDVLHSLHIVACWYGVRKVFLKSPVDFLEPRPNTMHEFMRGIHPENYQLRIEPYIQLNGDQNWLPVLEAADVILLAQLPETPEAVQTEPFFSFLSQFKQNKGEQLWQIVELLPLSPATASEWESRRNRVSHSVLREVDTYVEAMNEKTNKKMSIWRGYSSVLGDQAGWYLQLAHPEIIPASMRSGFIIPDSMDKDYQFIEMADAVEQMLRVIASENENKEKLLRTKPWCKEHLGLTIPAFIPKNNSVRGEVREQYSKKAVHVGNNKYFYLLNWDRPSLFRLRALSGEVGKRLVTPERMADWGLVDPDSKEAQRARQRAEIREAETSVNESIEPNNPEPKKRKCVRDIEPGQDEVPPKEIRNVILQMKDFPNNAPLLTLTDWCEIHIGLKEPILLRSNELIRLRNRQQTKSSQSRYSRCSVDLGNISYVIHRMTKSEFELLNTALSEL